LHRRQQTAWKGLHEFCTERLNGASPATALGMESIVMCRKREGKENTGLPHPDELTRAAIRWTHSLDAWQLVALNSIANQAKSFLIAFAMLESAGISIAHDDSTNATNSLPAPFSDVAQAVSLPAFMCVLNLV